jgi:AmiR/NasT family two-component response regulator
VERPIPRQTVSLLNRSRELRVYHPVLTATTAWSQRFAMNLSRILIVTKSQNVSHIWIQALRYASNGIIQEVPKQKVAYSSLCREYDLIIIDGDQSVRHSDQPNDVLEDFSDTILLCYRIHKHFDNPIILLTARTDEEYLLRAYQSGVAECVVEPVDPSLLVAKIMAWLRWSHSYHLNSTHFSIDSIRVAAIAPTQLTA